jgi:hypothetical protein
MERIKEKAIVTLYLHVALDGYEACPLTFREENKFGVFGNREVRNIFGPKEDEVRVYFIYLVRVTTNVSDLLNTSHYKRLRPPKYESLQTSQTS